MFQSEQTAFQAVAYHVGREAKGLSCGPVLQLQPECVPPNLENILHLKVLEDIANEERVHVGEFLRLLRELAPDEEKFYAKGAKEVEEIIEKLR